MKVFFTQLDLARSALTPGEPNVIMNSSVNLTSSHTEVERSDLDFVIVIFTSLILGLMILTTIIGKSSFDVFSGVVK